MKIEEQARQISRLRWRVTLEFEGREEVLAAVAMREHANGIALEAVNNCPSGTTVRILDGTTWNTPTVYSAVVPHGDMVSKGSA